MSQPFSEMFSVSKYVTRIIAAITLTSLGSMFIDTLFGLGATHSLLALSSLTYYGMVWQPVTYLFLVLTGPSSFGFVWLLFLSFTLYATLYIGERVASSFGARAFLRLFFGSGIAAAAVALFVGWVTDLPPLMAGPWPAILALGWLWTMLRGPIVIFTTNQRMIPLHWVLGGMICLCLFVLLVKGLFPAFCGYLAALFYAHAVGVCGHNLDAPFGWLAPLDRLLLKVRQLAARSYAVISWRGRSKQKRSPSIDSEEDELFVDAILEKIAREGERSLTKEERERLARRPMKKQ